MISIRPITSQPIPTTSPILHLPDFLVNNLKDKGIQELFPSQADIVPYLSRERYDHDVCVMSPTGSGKTLAYAIPIVKRTHARVIPRIRALIVLPTLELVSQVAAVFEYLVKQTDLKVQYMGIYSFTAEQCLISGTDILMSTPGRLLDHIQNTPEFTLQHLEFLVLDEADKLLAADVSWMKQLFNAIYNPTKGMANISDRDVNPFLDITTVRASHLHPKSFENTPPLRRWLFSATLTAESTQVAQLHLQSPVFFTTTQLKYEFPKKLTQYYVSVPGNIRGAVFVNTLQTISKTAKKILCFADSIESCHRLMDSKLNIAEYSGSLKNQERLNLLKRFNSGDLQALICSDLMSRGLDVESVDAIINYDAPKHIKVYVHRVGRTARGLSSGSSYTIIDPSEVVQFKVMTLKGANLNLVEKSIDLQSDAFKELRNKFNKILPELDSMIKQEKITGHKSVFEESSGQFTVKQTRKQENKDKTDKKEDPANKKQRKR